MTSLKNAIAIPIFDKQSGASIAVCQAYNFNEANYLSAIDESVLLSLSNIFSACIFNMDNLQGLMVTNDMLSTQFTLSNEAVVFVNTQQMITKVNKTAELLFNRPAETSVGLQLAEFFGTNNNQYLQVLAALTNRGQEKEEEGTIGKSERPLEPHHICQQLLGTYVE